MAVPELATVAAERIIQTLVLSQVDVAEMPVALVGHSLGALVAAYIEEHNLLAPLRTKVIIAVYGPMQGSVLLGWIRPGISFSTPFPRIKHHPPSPKWVPLFP